MPLLREAVAVLRPAFTRRGVVAMAALFVLAIAISLCAWWQPRFPGDLGLELLVQSLDGGALRTLMEWVSYLMGGWRAAALVVASGIVVWRCLGRLEGGLVLLAGLSSVLQIPIKLAVNRPRPAADLVRVLAAENDNGFPSGHALFAAVFLGFLAYLVATRLRRRSLRMLSLAGLLIIVLLTGASRVYLGVHWPSDILGGYLIGAVLLMALVWLHRTLQSRSGGE